MGIWPNHNDWITIYNNYFLFNIIIIFFLVFLTKIIVKDIKENTCFYEVYLLLSIFFKSWFCIKLFMLYLSISLIFFALSAVVLNPLNA